MQDSHCELVRELKYLDQPTCNILYPDHILFDQKYTQFDSKLSPLIGDHAQRKVDGGGFLLENDFMDANFDSSVSIQNSYAFLRAGPRKNIFWDTQKVRAAIVTCGDLLPGINTVIRELVMCLHYNYQIKDIFGVKYSYKGFRDYDMIRLDPQQVKTIHHLGGSILGMSHNEVDVKQIINGLKKNKINQLYIVGDYEDHQKIQIIYNEIKAQGLEICIGGIPKSIDNYFPVSDPSFGFESQIQVSIQTIHSASTMAQCKENGISIVKLNGKDTGFVCMEASLTSGEVNVCLVPEMDFELYGTKGLLNYILNYVKKHKYFLLAVASGAGQGLKDNHYDSNQDIGEYLRNKISEYCMTHGLQHVDINYFDACNQALAVPADSLDQKYCTALAQNCIHAVMAGFTNFTAAKVNGKNCYIPMKEVVSDNFPRIILPSNRMWQRLLSKTQQPSFINHEEKLQ